MQLQAGASLSKESVTILGDQRVASRYKQVVADSKHNFWGWHTTTMQQLSYLPGHKTKNTQTKYTKNHHLPMLQENTAYLQHVSSRSIQHWGYQAAPRRPFQIPTVNRNTVLFKTDVWTYYGESPNHQQFLSFPTTRQESQ